MCSFVAFQKPGVEDELTAANTYTKRRGPDATTATTVEGWTVLHNLLSMTGAVTPQPFIDTKKRRACFFNGEIYNWKQFGISGLESDGQALLPLYDQFGTDFIRKLDGEFAIVLFDFEKQMLVFATDPFATKPLWVGSHEDGTLGIASYESALRSLGISNPEKIPANTMRVYSLTKKQVLEERRVFDFDPTRQTKESVDDFLQAFRKAIEKRAKDAREKVFIGLSSGYDSGAIASELLRQGIPFKAYSIRGQEDQDVLEKRHALLSEAGEHIEAGYREYRNEKKELKGVCEDFVGSLNPNRYKPRHILEDAGAIGLGIICKKARQEGYTIYLSGQGADEILSDYRMHGHGLTGHSSISGEFPDDLAKEFPWRNFYEGAQRFYIAKEEHVAGAYGIEARYPFLDASLVQEFLYLSPTVKNAGYKYPLKVLFERSGYPFAPDTKVGFIRRKSTVQDRIYQVLDVLLQRKP